MPENPPPRIFPDIDSEEYRKRKAMIEKAKQSAYWNTPLPYTPESTCGKIFEQLVTFGHINEDWEDWPKRIYDESKKLQEDVAKIAVPSMEQGIMAAACTEHRIKLRIIQKITDSFIIPKEIIEECKGCNACVRINTSIDELEIPKT